MSDLDELKALRVGLWNLFEALYGPVPSGLTYDQAFDKIQAEVLGLREKTKVRVRRERLPDERQSITHKFAIAGHEGYLTVGMYPDGRPGELFLIMSKAGSVVSGLTDALGLAVSVGLQYGVPIDVFVRKYINSRFEPSGFTPNPQIKIAKSITDYIFRWIGLKFCPEDVPSPQPIEPDIEREPRQSVVPPAISTSGEACPSCGGMMKRSGSCAVCTQCGTTSGCS